MIPTDSFVISVNEGEFRSNIIFGSQFRGCGFEAGIGAAEAEGSMVGHVVG